VKNPGGVILLKKTVYLFITKYMFLKLGTHYQNVDDDVKDKQKF